MPPCASLPGRRGPVTNPWPAVGRPGPPGAKLQAAAHGIAKRRQRSAARGAQEVAHLHSTLEAGEPGPRGPWGGKGDARHGPVEGTPAGGIVSRSRVNATSTDSNADSEPMMGRTGCLNWARPDLREARGVIPGPTRPLQRAGRWLGRTEPVFMIQHEAGDGKKNKQCTAKQGDIEVDVA